MDGALTKERVYENGQRVRMTEWEGDSPKTYTYEREGGREIVKQFVGEEWQWTQVWNSGGKIIYGNRANGSETILRYGANGAREVLQRRPNGRDFLVLTDESGQSRIEDPEAIANWMAENAETFSGLRETIGQAVRGR